MQESIKLTAFASHVAVPSFDYKRIEHASVAEKSMSRLLNLWRGPVWRRNLLIGAAICFVVLILNIALLLSSQSRSGQFADVPEAFHNSSIILWKDACSRTESVSTWGHLLINVLSTALLTASAACMQCLGAPSRADVDRAHRSGISLRIGLLSLTNLRFISWKRRALWAIMGYNSALFTTSTETETLSLLTPSLDSVEALKAGGGLALNPVVIQATDMLSDLYLNGSLERLSFTDCSVAFSTGTNKAYNNVLLVSSIETGSDANGYHDWLDSDFAGVSSPGWASSCPPTNMFNKSMAQYSFFATCGWTSQPLTSPVPDGFFTIDYCLAQSFDDSCLVELNATSMRIVIVANVIKLLVLLYVGLSSDFDPLITVGDAIASFLHMPDPVTAGLGIVTSGNLAWLQSARSSRSSKRWKHDHENHKTSGKSFTQRRYLWWHSIGLRSWLIATITVVCILIRLASSNAVTFSWSSWGRVGAGQLLETTFGNSLATNALIANIPQIILSLYYLLFTSLITTMLVTSELTSFAEKRKPLRVSSPRGSQRSTYWLQVPFRYAIPLTAFSVLMHWLLSQALFAVHIDVLDIVGQPNTEASTNAIVRCDAALLILFICAVLTATVTIALARFKKFATGSVLIAHDSLAISAASQVQKAEPADACERPIMYGVLQERGGSGYRKVGFSSLEVENLVDGAVYDCEYTLERLDNLWYTRKDAGPGSASLIKHRFGRIQTRRERGYSSDGGDSDDYI